MNPGWEPLGRVSPRALGEARVVLHHAAQLVAAVGRSLVPPQPDDGHTSLEWLGEARTLAGQAVPGRRPWRAALRPDDLVLAVVGDGVARELPLAGRTPAEAFAWLTEEARVAGAPAGALRSEAPYAIPASAVAGGAAFSAATDGARAELARWFANADGLLRDVAAAWPGSAPVRVWPHHFDVGSVLPLGGGTGEEASAIGSGLSPGDEGSAEPYWYATRWPQPAGAGPGLPAGRWHGEGWTGALLTATDLVAAGEAAAQGALAARFLSGAVESLRAWRRGATS
jgi:hypothetical protein